MSIIVASNLDGFYDDFFWGTYQDWMSNFRYSLNNFLDAGEFALLDPITDISGDGTLDVDITNAGSSAVIDGVIFTDAANVGAGTGNYNTFLALQDDNDPDQVEEGFNSGKAVGGASDPNPEDNSNDEMDASKSEAILLGAIPIKWVDGVAYYEFRVDLNEANSGDATLISLDKFQLYVGPYDLNTALPNPTPTSANNQYGSNVDLVDTWGELFNLDKVYDMDAGGDVSVLMDEGNSSGSGNDDYAVLVPVSYFEGYDPAKDYVYLYVQMGAAGGDGDGNGVIGNAPSKNFAGDDLTWVVNGGFHEWNLQNAVIITGTKFLDANGNGVQDEGETGMEGVTIFIDNNLDGDVDATDGNGVLDAGEMFDITDEFGNYSFGGIPLYDSDYDIEINEVVPPGTEPTTDLPITVTIDSSFESGKVLVLSPIGNKLLTPDIEIVKTAVLADEGECADETTDVINYTVTVTNTGDLDLENVVVTDQFEGEAAVKLDDGDGILEAGEVVRSGDTGDDNILSVGETWTYTYSRNVTQNDIDTIGIDGDGLLENTAEVDAIVSVTDQPISDADDADIEVCPDPDFTIDKEIVSVSGGVELEGGDPLTTADDAVDSADDTITYKITITNTGNVSLSLVDVTDTFEGVPEDIVAAMTESINDDNVLEVGETWTYEWTETVTQEQIDEICATDETITNSVSATFSFGDPESVHYYEETKDDEVETPVECTPDFTIDKEIVSVSGGVELEGGDPLTTADDAVDSADDTITYKITITNTGNVSLSLVDVTDTFEGVPEDIVAAMTESINDDNVLEVGETWTYEWTETVTQEQIDEICATDETITNSVSATFSFGDPESVHYYEETKDDEVETPVECTPDFTIDKEIVSVSGGVELEGGDPLTTADDAVDSADDTITYKITITNTGNVSLSLVDVTDTFEGVPEDIVAAMTESINDDNVLEVGETWTYEWTETVTQEQLDEICATDETITNSVSATFSFGDPESVHYYEETKDDEVETPVECTPDVEVIKNVKTDYTGNDYVAADDLTKPQASTSTLVMFEVILTNTGNITLTGVTLEDILDGSNLDYNTVNAGGEAVVYADYDGDGVWDIDGGTWNDLAGTDQIIDFDLAPDAVIKVYYQYESVLGNHVNVAEVTTDQGVSDDNEAGYYVLPSEECVGVGTPGFWSNNGYVFWNGTPGDEAKHAGQPGFADGELLYAVDSDGNGVIDGNDQAGLLIGDWDGNGIENGLEDTLFISLEAAQALINASNRQVSGKQADGVWILGRDMVASWLNYLANGGDDGDCFDDRYGDDGFSPGEALGEAIDWFQSLNIGGDSQISLTELKTGAAVRTNSTTWKAGADDLHAALDEFNNYGTIDGDVYCCDRDDALALIAIAQVNDNTADMTPMTLIA